MEETLPNLVVFVLKELLKRAIIHGHQLLGSCHVTLHQAVHEHGALLQMGICAIVHDFHELLLEQGFGFWCSFEEQLEDAYEQSA